MCVCVVCVLRDLYILFVCVCGGGGIMEGWTGF